ncbi:unnamed protein product [Ixodes persulcatus]
MSENVRSVSWEALEISTSSSSWMMATVIHLHMSRQSAKKGCAESSTTGDFLLSMEQRRSPARLVFSLFFFSETSERVPLGSRKSWTGQRAATLIPFHMVQKSWKWNYDG